MANGTLKNLGRSINLIPGINGVTAGGNASVNMAVNRRYHRNIFRTLAVNYTAPVITLVGAGTYNATLTPTLANGAIASVAITNAGSAMTAGVYTSAGGGVKITDATGVGAQLSVTVAAGNSITATPIVISGGTPGPANPATVLTTLRQLVNGVTIRDITPANILAIAAACGYAPQYGELPLWYTDPKRNFLRDNELTSWDMTGQGTFEIQMGIASTATNPSISGIMEFDGRQNVRTVKSSAEAQSLGVAIGTQIPILQPVSQHQQGFALAAGQNDINNISHNYPISRMWILGSTPGNIYRLEVYQDGNKVLEGYTEDINEAYAEYGFLIGNVFTAPVLGGGLALGSPGNTGVISGNGAATQVASAGPNGSLAGSPWLGSNGVFPFDAAFIADPDGRPWKALRAKDLIVRIYSVVQQNVTIVVESLPGAFAA
jgi:hypothetical protein